MSIRLNCPRCKRPLSIPGKKAGGYVHCPECGGRLWVPKDAPSDATIGSATGGAAAAHADLPAGPAGAVAPPGAPAATLPMIPTAGALGEHSPGRAATPAASPPVPTSAAKVARLIPADAAASKLSVAAGGQLPALHLQDGQDAKPATSESSSVRPLVLLGVVSLSVVLAIALALYDPNPQSSSLGRQQADARRMVEEQFFGELGSKEPLKPYQICLREAQRAHTQGDRQRERELYRNVLGLLWAERPKDAKGLTGSRARDKQLEQCLSVLLRD